MWTTSSSSKLAWALGLAGLLLASHGAAQGGDDRPPLTYGETPSKATKPARSDAARSRPAGDEVRYPAPPAGSEITVSDRDYNDFIFPSPVTQLVFPAGSPVVGEPVYLSGNTQVLLQFKRGYDKPVQMIVETEGGQVFKLYLKPRPVNGVTHRVANARPAAKAAKPATSANDAAPTARNEDIELLKVLVRGEVPPGYEPIALPRPTRFDKFTVVPLAGWGDGTSRRLLVYSLVAVPGQAAVVAPPQFYRPGIAVVMVDGDTVDDNNAPTLYVVEELGEAE